MSKLILLRHGQSQWNLENRFTGWVDVDLTAEGEAQASQGGALIKAAGVHIDRVYSSVLKRANRTAQLALAAAGQGDLPMIRDALPLPMEREAPPIRQTIIAHRCE